MKCANLGYRCLFLVVCLSLGFLSPSWAQAPAKSPEVRAIEEFRWMQQNLQLNEEQNRKAFDIIDFFAKAGTNELVQPGENGAPAVKRNKYVELRQLLTADQYQKYEEKTLNVRSKNKKPHGMMMQGRVR